MKSTYSGSCHCGGIRFKVRVDLAPPGDRGEQSHPGRWYATTFKCNCSYCSKTRFWKAFVHADDFEWVAGREAISNYQFAEREIDHYFCKTCGIQPFMHSTLEQLGGNFYCINVACLDDVEDELLAVAPVAFEDGRHDEWTREPRVTKYL
jgi:hypothetical protein